MRPNQESRGPALNAGECRFDACHGHAPVAQSAEAAASNPAQCRFKSCSAHHPFSLAAQSVGPTNRDPGFESLKGYQSSDRKPVRTARASADNRVAGGSTPPACTNQTGDRHAPHARTGAACRRNRSRDRTRSVVSLDRPGIGLLTRAQEVRALPGSPIPGDRSQASGSRIPDTRCLTPDMDQLP